MELVGEWIKGNVYLFDKQVKHELGNGKFSSVLKVKEKKS